MSTDDDEAGSFLGGAGDAGDDLADFLTTDRPDHPSTGPGRWFTSRYDGSCDSCGADFSEGEEIRADGEGGWQGRDCCGEDDGTPEQAQRRADRPKSLNQKVPIEQGRYVMPHPTAVVTRGKDKGQPKRYSGQRMTSFVKLAADHRALTAWELRCALVGAARSPELIEEVIALLQGADPAAVVKAERDALNRLAERAKTAAGSSERSRHGTVLHKHTEEIDSGRRTVEQVPELYRRDAAAYFAEMEIRGYRSVPDLIERTTTIVSLEVMGTFDRVLLCPDGKYRIGDVKSGDDPSKYAFLEIAAQLAGYQRGFNETGVAQWSGEGNPRDWRTWTWARPLAPDGREIRVESDFAVVMHVPFGSGRCQLYEVDLAEGHRELAACELVRSRQKIKSPEVMRDLRNMEPGPMAVGLEEDMLAFEAEEKAVVTQEPCAVCQLSGHHCAQCEKRIPHDSPVLYGDSYCPGCFAEAGVPVTPSETAAAACTEPESGDMLVIAARESAKPAAPTWEQRFAAVTSRQEASALYQEARSHVQELGMNRLLALVELGRKALVPVLPEPPF